MISIALSWKFHSHEVYQTHSLKLLFISVERDTLQVVTNNYHTAIPAGFH